MVAEGQASGLCADVFAGQRVVAEHADLRSGRPFEFLDENTGDREVAIVAAQYGDRVIGLVGRVGSPDVYEFDLSFFAKIGLSTTGVRKFPRLTPQFNERTCLPAAVTYIQNIVQTSMTSALKLVPDQLRAGWMSAFMTYNPWMYTPGAEAGHARKVQFLNQDLSFDVAGIDFHRSSTVSDLIAHLREKKVAVVGTYAKTRALVVADADNGFKVSYRSAVQPSPWRERSAHAMIATDVIRVGGEDIVMLIDPQSGEMVPMSLRSLSLNFIEAVLIDTALPD